MAKKITVDDLLNIEPNKVPTDVKSYSTFIYSYPKAGKTTFINDMYGEKVLFIATERRHDAIPGAMVINVDSWGEFLQTMKALKKPELHEKFDAICIDTVGRLEEYCNAYTLANLGIDDLSDAEWGKGFAAYNKELEKGLTLIEKSGYVPVFIAHAKTETKKVLLSEASESEKNVENAKLTKEKGKEYIEYQKTVPDIKNKFFNMINRTADNILFLDLTVDSDGVEHRKVFYRDSLQHMAGATFKDMPEYTDLSPQAYQEAVDNAIKSLGNDNIIQGKREQSHGTNYDFDSLMSEVAELGKKLQQDGKAKERNQVIENVLGKGNKVKDLNQSQAEVLSVLVDELKEIA